MTDEMTMSDVDQLLFESAASPQSEPTAEQVTQLLQEAGLQRQSPQAPEPTPEPAPEPAPESAPESVAEPAPAQDPLQLQQFMERQQQLNEEVLSLQKQLSQQPKEPQFDPNDTNQIVQQMEQIGLDPSDPAHHFLFRESYERRQNEAYYAEQMRNMSEYVSYMQNESSRANHEATLAPKVEETMQAYGNIPAETISSIKAQAATILTQAPNQYSEAQAIELAVKPYLPLLQALKGREAPAVEAQPQTQTQAPNPGSQAVLAAALAGRSSGHSPGVSEIDIQDLEKKLFLS